VLYLWIPLNACQAMKQGHHDIARIYAQNAVRKQNEKLNLLQLASRVDAVAGRVQTAVTMRQVTGNMQKVVKSMDVAMKSMNLERVHESQHFCYYAAHLFLKTEYLIYEQQITAVMDGFEKNFNDLDVVDEFTREATSSATAVGTPQDDVDRLMAQTADKVGVELSADLEEATPAKTKIGPTEQEEQGLNERLRALRN
jgi:charged multivesicular body protein 1